MYQQSLGKNESHAKTWFMFTTIKHQSVHKIRLLILLNDKYSKRIVLYMRYITTPMTILAIDF